MATWGELRAARPDLADAGASLLYQHGVGLAFLATVRADGGPRVHPMCPVLHEAELFAFLVPSPKRDDLLRDGRYSMHSFPADDNEDAFYVSGGAWRVDDESVRTAVVARYLTERGDRALERASGLDEQILFRFDIEACLLTRTDGHGDPAPRHTTWHGR